MNARVCVFRVHKYMCVFTCTHMYVPHVHICVFTCTHIYVSNWTRVCVPREHTAVIRRAGWCVFRVYIYVSVHVCIYVSSRVNICVCSMCAHMCVPIEHVFVFQMIRCVFHMNT